MRYVIISGIIAGAVFWDFTRNSGRYSSKAVNKLDSWGRANSLTGQT
jgi:hypothetical protein